jgi:uncharacterized protein
MASLATKGASAPRQPCLRPKPLSGRGQPVKAARRPPVGQPTGFVLPSAFASVNALANPAVGNESANSTVPEGAAPSERTELRRFAARGRYDREAVYAILDQAFLCHVGYVRDGQPYVVPISFWRVEDKLYLHGSASNGMLTALGAGIPVCVTVSHVDGIALSRVINHHSFNYRSVMILGTAEAVTDPAEKRLGMQRFVDRILPGRWQDGVIDIAPSAIDHIAMVRMDLREASAKLRSGGINDSPALAARSTAWAGHVPIQLAVGRPVPDAHLPADVAVPDYVRSLAGRFGAVDLAAVALDIPALPPASPKPPR